MLVNTISINSQLILASGCQKVCLDLTLLDEISGALYSAEIL